MLAVAEHKGIQSELIPRIATGFCSGMARTDGMCGAVSGGIMAIGLSLGRRSAKDAVDPAYECVRAFLQQFTARFKALNCLALTGVHLGTADGQKTFKDGEKIVQCSNYVGEAANIVVKLVG